ncbi:MAG: hypothetical protein AUJ20_13355 [Comamonadaceae bacterium CG1_02_60_18]|nr:MAG: hypothetical protein AUJ20_13355 [Comamonadaceae bacterium CG1_02_60_18]PIQ56204.1 MAG: hypothetical protein COW02_01475 [Comamonadaceae bacterium CG12_big_fil_rev_8_21_14_0_65_59_15]
MLWASLVSASHALTLGDLRGNAVIGHALDVSVVVQASPGEEVSAACFKADVFHADAAQASPTITLRPLSTTSEGSYRVRVQSAALVDEPVVTLELHSTCTSALSRRYVVLADFPVVVMPAPQQTDLPQVAAPVAAAPVSALPQTVVPAVQTTATTVISPTPAAQVAKPVAKKPVVAKRAVVRKKAPPHSVVKPAASASTPAATPATPAEPAKPALKLEALNLPASLTDSVANAPSGLPAPEAALQASQIQSLQEELKQLRLQAAKTNAQLAEMQLQLQSAQSDRISLQVFYVVLVLLMLCAGVLAWLLWQRYRAPSTHETVSDVLGRVALPATMLQKTVVPVATTSSTEAAPLIQTVRSPVTATAVKAPDSVFDSHVVSPTLPGTLADSELRHGNEIAFTTTQLQGASDRSDAVVTNDEVDLDLDLDLSHWSGADESSKPALTASESVLDIRQQAESFVSLGQTERALVILKKHISECERPNPLIYLDLLSLFHSLGDKTDFRDYRTAFNQHFNCVLPDFPAYHLEGLDLMSYPEELAQLTPVWNRPEAVTFLHACIYRAEQTSVQKTFELAAFRDLLLLLSISEQVLGSTQA